MRKKTMFATLVLFAIGSMGTCVASQLPHDGNILTQALTNTPEYVAASNSQNDGKIFKVAARKKPPKVKVKK